MPIQFPKPTGPRNFITEQQMLKNSSKAFDVVPSPNLMRIGAPLASPVEGTQNAAGWSADPGCGGLAPQFPNTRDLGKPFVFSDQLPRISLAAQLGAVYDSIAGMKTAGQQGARLTGVSRDATGNPLGGCTIKIFNTADDVLTASAISDGSGNWTAYPDRAGPYYFVEYLAGSPDVFGTSPNTNASVPFTPGQ